MANLEMELLLKETHLLKHRVLELEELLLQSLLEQYHTCAILDDGTVSCWGRNLAGGLGDGTTTDRNTPTQTSSLGTGRTAVAISSGNHLRYP